MQADHTYRRAACMGITHSRTVYTCCLFAALSHDGVHARSRWLHTSYTVASVTRTLQYLVLLFGPWCPISGWYNDNDNDNDTTTGD